MEKVENSRRIGEMEVSELLWVPHSESMHRPGMPQVQAILRVRIAQYESAVGAEFVSPGGKAWENSFKEGPRHGGSGHGNIVCFSTKDRSESIPPEIQEKLWAYVSGIAKNEQVPLLAIGGTNNHVHLIIALPASVSLSEAISKIKCPKQLARSSQIDHDGSASTGARLRGRRATEHSALEHRSSRC